MKTYIHEIFDSRNTSFDREIKARDFKSAVNKVKQCNIHKHYIKESRYSGEWCEIENGNIVSASSFPAMNY